VLGDLFAAIVGISFGRIRIGKKSLEGTVAMFVTCYLVALPLFWHAHFAEYVALVGALTACLVELWGIANLDDNLTIPLSSAIALHIAILRTEPFSTSLSLP
jgi:diacylglycerol kinase (CTP)